MSDLTPEDIRSMDASLEQAILDLQRETLDSIWDGISAYCKKHSVTRDQLASGRVGVPVDGGKLEARIGYLRLTRNELAERTGSSYAMITEIVAGQRDPLPVLLSQLARELSCAVGDLFLDEDFEQAGLEPESERDDSGHSGSH